jgi:hypothetical protein
VIPPNAVLQFEVELLAVVAPGIDPTKPGEAKK